MSERRIVLVIDDDEDLRESVCELLEEDGYRAISVSDGRTALDWLRAGDTKPQVILLDLMMPGMNGFQFREEQVKDAEAATVPVVLTSAHAKLQHETAALGVAGYLEKPIDVQLLLDTVERFCS